MAQNITANNEPSHNPTNYISNVNPSTVDKGTPSTQNPIIVNIEALAYLPIPIIRPLPIPPKASNKT